MKTNTLKQQRINAELESIIEEFSLAMRNANKAYIASKAMCVHDNPLRFTASMSFAWAKYREFCGRHPNE